MALEDSPAGVLPASRAGMTTLLIPDSGRIPNANAVSAAYCVLDSLHDAKRLLSEFLSSAQFRQQ